MNEVKENTVTASHKIEIYRGSRKHPKRMSYDATWEIKDRFKAMSKIIDELFLLAEKYINAQALPAGEFILDEDSAQQCLKTDLNRFFSGQTDGIELRYTAELGNDTLTIAAKANVNDNKVLYEVGTPVSSNESGNGSLPAAENTADSKEPVEKTKAEDFPYLSALRIAVEKGYGNVFLYDLINMLNEDEDMYRQIQVEFSARMRYHNQRHGGKKNDEKRNA